MDTTEEVLVVILSSALAIFLVLAIVGAYKIIKLVNTLQNLADKAEHIAEAAETMAESARKAFDVLSVGRVFTNITKSFVNRSKESKSRRKGE